jgi:hypothetical protein
MAEGRGSYIEPGQAASRDAQDALFFSTSTFLQAEDAPKPVYRGDLTEIIFLLVQVRSDVVAEECEERGNGEGFVAVAKDLKVDGVFVVEVREEGNGRVDGNHEENANDA